ncbi:MAG: glycosyltransferase family 4 protein [Rhodospirillaceae bacterium]|jgi:glycosyltransferase involved in cell wall biosynthesis|nr:glycosyltransferase family 4 protein [Rhodospirillaceae bacterium]
MIVSEKFNDIHISNKRQNVVLQILPTLTTGGVERGTVDVANALMEAKWTSIVASNGGHMVSELNNFGVNHIKLPLHSKNPLVMKTNISRLEAIIRDYGIDIVHVRSRAPAWSAYLATKRTKVHFVTTFHGTYNAGMFGLKNVYNSIMTKGELVIATSQFIADHLQKVFRINPSLIRIIQRGIDLSRFDPERVNKERIIKLARRWCLSDNHSVIMLPGRLTRWKGQLVLIEAIAIMKHIMKYQNIRCLLVGSDQGRESYTNEINSLIKKHDLSDIVYLVNECNDMPAAYMLADVVVSASTDPEAFGRVIVESQAMGRQVVATNNGAACENMLDGLTGILIPPNNPIALSSALNYILDLDSIEKKVRATKAIEFVRNNFTRELMCKRTLDVYVEILS